MSKLPWDVQGEERKRLTAEAFDDPQAGDTFHEMFSHWVFVVKRTPKHVWWMTASGPCTLPDDGKMMFGTLQEFRDKYAYGSIDGYYVDLNERESDVEGWYEVAKEKEKRPGL